MVAGKGVEPFFISNWLGFSVARPYYFVRYDYTIVAIIISSCQINKPHAYLSIRDGLAATF
ncbi:MAG TPA: hypothetical protein DCP92_03450 [Nitrospiraceae bacterium]|nr:hypothetical protein [Nitrospiraceae bacterium]